MGVPVGLSLAALLFLACSPIAGERSEPAARTKNEAPLNNVSEAERERASGTLPSEPGELRTDFKAMGKDIPLRASAELSEVQDGVRVHVEVSEGQPGVVRMAVEEAPCRKREVAQTRPPTPIEQRGATPAVMAGAPAGGIEIQGSGQAEFTTTLKGKHLEPDAENSLAGQALVLYEARDLPSPMGRTSEVPVACAMVPGR